MDVELPNGIVIKDVPEGTPRAQIMERAIRGGLARPEDFDLAPAPTSGFVMGLKDPISGGAQLLPRALAYGTSLGGAQPNPVSRFFESEARRVDEMVRAEQAAYDQQRAARGETGFDFPRLGGNIVSPANVVPAATAAATITRAAPVTRAVVGGAVSGAMQPVTQNDFAGQKTEQIGLGGVFGAAGEKIAGAGGRVLNPLVSKAEQTMRDLGITPTTGQTLGKGAKSLEEFAQYMPLVGTAVQDARERTLFQFNQGVINNALKPIKEKLPADVIGRDAIEYATQKVSDAYDDVLGKIRFTLDFNTSSNILGALNKAKLLSPDQRQAAVDYVNSVALSKFSGKPVTGQEYKAIESDLRKKASRLMSSQMESEREVGDALFGVLNEFKKSLYSQNPKLTPQLRRVDAAYGDLSAAKVAAANSGALNGVFTPKQFSTAVRQGDKTLNKSAYAKGSARSQRLSDSAMQVLGDEAGETLAGRYAFGGAGLFGIATQPEVGIPVALGGRMLYSEPGQRAADVLLRSRPEALQATGRLFSAAAPYAGAVGGAQPVFQYNIQERRPTLFGAQ
jgi:hypothetical protein